MFEKPCNLARAARYFKGGGGGSSIDVPSFNQTLGDAIRGFGPIKRLYRGFADSEPLLNEQMPILQELGRYGTQARKQFQGVPGQLMSPFGQLPGQMLNILKGQLPIAQTGELTQDQRNEAVQQARAGAQARGDIYSNPAIFAEAMNRRKYADARQQQAIGNIEGLGQAALGSALQRDQGAAGLDTSAFGLASGREASAMGLQQGGMGIAQGAEQLLGYPSQQLTQGELGRVGAFQTLFGPEENLAGDWLKAQAGANVAGAGQASSNKNSTIGTIGTIVGAAATAY